MTVIATALKHLMAAGMAGDALIAAIEEIESELRPARSSNAARQAAYRERMRAAEDVTNNVTDVTDVTLRNGEKVSQKKQSNSPSQSPPVGPPFPVSEALAVWNEMAGKAGLTKAITATGKRQAMLRQRLAEHGEDGFRRAVAAVASSKFCRGDNDRGWRADIGFMLRPDNFVKLLEGGYAAANEAKPAAPAKPPETIEELERAIRFNESQGFDTSEYRRRLDVLKTGPPGDPNVARLVGQATRSLRVSGGRAFT